MGTLFIVSTPIGNLEDITIRALKTLFSCDYIACEDTRRTGLLINQLELKFTTILRSIVVNQKKAKLISFYDQVEEQKTFEIIKLLKDGKFIALVSDAGTPLLADPGYKLIRACIQSNIKIESIPGPSSVLTALTQSGLPLNHILFMGFLPPRHSKRIQIFSDIMQSTNASKHIHPTIVAFESPHRISECLSDLKAVFGDREIVLARELTKIHEEIIRGKISQIERKAGQLKGELVLLFSL